MTFGRPHELHHPLADALRQLLEPAGPATSCWMHVCELFMEEILMETMHSQKWPKRRARHTLRDRGDHGHEVFVRAVQSRYELKGFNACHDASFIYRFKMILKARHRSSMQFVSISQLLFVRNHFRSSTGTVIVASKARTTTSKYHMAAINYPVSIINRRVVANTVSQARDAIAAALCDSVEARSASALKERSGWQFVPNEATKAMLQAGQASGKNCAFSYAACYRAMLAAAPSSEVAP